MADTDRSFRDRYRFESANAQVELRRMEGRDFAYNPEQDTGNVIDQIFENAVYGGSADPERTGQYRIYEVDFSGHEHDLGQSDARFMEDFRDKFDKSFSGWVYDDERRYLYALSEPDEEQVENLEFTPEEEADEDR